MLNFLRTRFGKYFRRNKRVAIVTPIYRLPLTDDEQISLRHLRHYLGRYDRFVAAPEHLALDFPDFQILRFNDSYFSGIHGYNTLTLSPDFYREFEAYDYVLIYQLDCLVFSKRLDKWCDKQWDYAGAPWFKHYGENTSKGFWAVGNGGFSLKRVKSCLAVLRERKSVQDLIQREMQSGQTDLASLLSAHGYQTAPEWFIEPVVSNSDLFWSFEASRLMPGFRVATPKEAVAFSFESAPRYCFEQNSKRLPFGCHAWPKFDRQFWEPYLLRKKNGYLSALQVWRSKL